MKKIQGITAVFLICGIFSILAFYTTKHLQTKEAAGGDVQYIIDAGHGIPDGGAVGTDGTTEQELNLAIALQLSGQLKKRSVSHVLTRSDENSIFTEGDTIHAKKVSDIKERIRIAEENKGVPFISIHMNTYPSSSVHGIQVFYTAGNQGAKAIAEKLQNEFNAEIQPDNTKVIKEISKNIYLFSHIDNPSVLIECGFISNGEELNALKSEDYQKKLSGIIAEVLAAHG